MAAPQGPQQQEEPREGAFGRETEARPGRPGTSADGAQEQPTGEAREEPGRAAPDGERRRHERPMGSLVRELFTESSALMRAEIALARTEMKESVTSAQRGVASMGTGAAVFHAGVLGLVAAAILGLSLVWPAWLAALVIGAAVALCGGILLAAGRRKVSRESLKPERTLGSVEDARRFARKEKARAVEKWQ